ncbi:MAG: hypothetical protein JWO82_304 [Akkermansiaceae bacterium]|nr:hypothetical protein [Akkermansiaceae bacterium]
MHYVLIKGRAVCSASEFQPDPPKIWQAGLVIHFSVESFCPVASGAEIEIIDFSGSGWFLEVLSAGVDQDSASPEIRISARVLRKITLLPAGQEEISDYIHRTFDGLVHLSLANYSDQQGAAMIRLILSQGRRPVIHKPGMPPTEALLGADGSLVWEPFPGLER